MARSPHHLRLRVRRKSRHPTELLQKEGLASRSWGWRHPTAGGTARELYPYLAGRLISTPFPPLFHPGSHPSVLRIRQQKVT